MKTNKKAWLSAMAAIILVAVIGVGFAFKPFAKEKVETKKATVIWYYHSDSPLQTDITNGSNWALFDPNKPGCGTNTGNLPCKLEVDDSIMTQAQLDHYFYTEFNDTKEYILDAALERRPIP